MAGTISDNDRPKSPISSLTDDQGNQYRVEDVFGQGIEGMTVKAFVESVAPNVKNLSKGAMVAIKLPLNEPNEDKKLATEREVGILSREGSLYSKKTPRPTDKDQKTYLIVQAIPGKDLTNIIYDINEKNEIVGKNKDLSEKDKNNISYGLIRDFYAMQLLGIVHCDLKPDNILYDTQTGTTKIIDFGNSVDLTQPYRHEYFEGAGVKYIPPEAKGGYEGERINQNSLQTDAYSLGVTLAAVNSQKAYDSDAENEGDRYGDPHLIMNDILDPNKGKPKEMPADLYQIIQHIADPDPARRPENIALAKGVKDSQVLKDVHQVQEKVNELRKMLVLQEPTKITQSFNEKEQKQYKQISNLDEAVNLLKGFKAINETKAFEKTVNTYAKSKEIPKSAHEILKKMLSNKEEGGLEKLAAELNNLKTNSTLFNVRSGVLKVLEDHKDLATIRLGINEIKQKLPRSKENKGILSQLDKTLEVIDTFALTQARKLQAVRTNALSNKEDKAETVQTNPVSDKLKEVVNSLVDLANQNKKSPTQGSLMFSAGNMYSPEGLKCHVAGMTIRSLRGFPNAIEKPEEVEKMLTKLASEFEKLPSDNSNKKNLVDKVSKIMDDFASVKQQLSSSKPEESRSKPKLN